LVEVEKIESGMNSLFQICFIIILNQIVVSNDLWFVFNFLEFNGLVAIDTITPTTRF
jgi:hypothetical protein